MNRKFLLCAFSIICSAFLWCNNTVAQPVVKANIIPVSMVWSAHPVGFSILTSAKYQYVCFYDTARVMTIAQRPLNSDKWKMRKLPSVTGWDSHNYVTIAIDRDGYLHVLGNMHAVPLLYFRSEKPEDIDALVKMPITGKNEDRVTYPVFFKDDAGDLYFQYRDGRSGQGTTYWDKYDTATKTWKNALGKAIFDGENSASAYMSGLTRGPDGYFYFTWMWRLTPIANTCHNLSMVRSADLVNWQTVNGKPVSLPIKWSDNSTIVDAVGPWNGLINMGFRTVWDAGKRPLIAYHKYDGRGVSQFFISRLENKQWISRQVSDFEEYTWNINLGGSLDAKVIITGLNIAGNGDITLAYHHDKYGDGSFLLDATTMTIKERKQNQIKTTTAAVAKTDTMSAKMVEHRVVDNTGKYVLIWKTLRSNRDKPIDKPYPPYVQLVVEQILR